MGLRWVLGATVEDNSTLVQVLFHNNACGCNQISRLQMQSCFRPNLLTYWDRVTNICVSKITIICLGQAPSHYLNQCWSILNWITLGNTLQWNLNQIYIFSFNKMHLKRRQGIRGRFVWTLMCWNGTYVLEVLTSIIYSILYLNMHTNLSRQQSITIVYATVIQLPYFTVLEVKLILNFTDLLNGLPPFCLWVAFFSQLK